MMKKQKEKVRYIDYACQVGERVQWTDMTGKTKHEGVISKWDDYTATVKLDDGTEVTIDC
jgi:hypothetical protein